MNSRLETGASGDDLAERLAQAEAALRERKHDLQLIVDSIPAQVAVITPTGEVETLNQPCLEYFGKTLDQLKGWASSDPVHPEDLPQVVKVLTHALETGETYEVDSRHRRFDGVYRWFHVRGFPLKDTDGRILRWCVLLTDIDDRKRAEAQLAGEKLLLEMVARGGPLEDVLIALCRFVEDTAADCKCGIYLIDWSGPTFHTAVAPSLPASFNDALEGLRVEPSAGPCAVAALTRSQVIAEDFESELQWQQSMIRPLALSHGLRAQWSTPICSRDGSVLGTFAIFQDHPSSPTQVHQDLIAQVTHIASIAIERALADEVLQSNERNLSLIINTIPTHIYVLNTEGSVQYVNQAVMDYTGLSLEDVKQEDYRDRVIHPEDFKRVRAPRAASLRRGAPFSTEQRVLGNDGQYRWFLVRYKPLLDEHGRIVRWYVAAFDIEDRKRAEEALRSVERDLNQIINTIPAMAWSARTDGSAEFLNQHYLDYIGLSSKEAGDWGWTTAVHPDDREALGLNWQRIMASTQSGEAEGRLRRHDGTYRWFLFRANPIRDESGAIVKWYGINTDIDDRKRAVEELQANQDLLDLAQKSARAMAFDWYVQQEVNIWSPEQEALYGLPPGSFDGTYQSWKKLIYAPDWPLLLKAINHAQETGEVAVEFRVQWPDGNLHWLATNGQMFFDDQGKPFRMVGFTSDVTRRKLIEEELRRSEAFLAQAQQLSRTGSFSWRVASDEITWSEELYRIYEFDPGIEITLEVIRTRVHPEDLTLYEKMVEQARNGADDFEWQYRLLMPDQSIKYMHAVAQATREPGGQLEYIAAVRDVTARRISDEALDKARAELAHVARITSLGALTASIAHEVNQPLSGIITNASTCVRMLDGDPPNVDGARETAKRTIRDGHRASDVITRLRALFTNKYAATELIDLNEATEEVIALSRTELERNGVITRTQLAAKLPVVTGDRVQLQQVILNLLRNGSDAMSSVDDRPRELWFRTEVEEGDRVRLSVQDAGTGFEPQSLDRLFQTFYTTKEEGMGIGLSVSRSIIENHRGRLWATPNDGPGVTFSFSLPCVYDAGGSRSKNDDKITEQ